MTQPEQSGVVNSYFTEFLQTKLNQPLLPKLQRLSVTFRITLDGTQVKSWRLIIQNGLLTSVFESNEPTQCTFRLSDDTFRQIIAGLLSPQMAFFKRKVEIRGEIETGLRLATVLADFFKKFPYPAAHTK